MKRVYRWLLQAVGVVGGPVVALVCALSISGLIISVFGVNPLEALKYIIIGSFGSTWNIAITLVKATPLMLAGLGLVVCYRTGLISVGAEGQIIVGGFTAAMAGIYLVALPAPLLLPIMVLAGAIGGGIWGAIPGYLKARMGVSEVINTIMLNYIAFFLINYLVDVPFRDPEGYFPQTALLQVNAILPRIWPGTRLHLGFVLGLLGAVLVYILMWRLPLGYQLRATGSNRTTAEFAGLKVNRNIVLSMTIAGAFAGVAGMSEIAGIHKRVISGFSSEYGFDAMAVALLGRKHPLGTIIAAIFFGALRVGASEMQRVLQVPASLIFVVQGLIIIFILLEELIGERFIYKWLREKSN